LGKASRASLTAKRHEPGRWAQSYSSSKRIAPNQKARRRANLKKGDDAPILKKAADTPI
jgi:hypothetical protein